MIKWMTIKIINPIKTIYKTKINIGTIMTLTINKIMHQKTRNFKNIFILCQCKTFNQQVFQISNNQVIILNNKINNIIKTL